MRELAGADGLSCRWWISVEVKCIKLEFQYSPALKIGFCDLEID